MPHQHCPTCKLTVHLADGGARGGPCPRCGAALADEPPRVLGVPAPALDPETVRGVLARRGGRLQRTAPARRRAS
jgi:hypothetical protein